jgi:hypothetical protein
MTMVTQVVCGDRSSHVGINAVYEHLSMHVCPAGLQA